MVDDLQAEKVLAEGDYVLEIVEVKDHQGRYGPCVRTEFVDVETGEHVFWFQSVERLDLAKEALLRFLRAALGKRLREFGTDEAIRAAAVGCRVKCNVR